MVTGTEPLAEDLLIFRFKISFLTSSIAFTLLHLKENFEYITQCYFTCSKPYLSSK